MRKVNWKKSDIIIAYVSLLFVAQMVLNYKPLTFFIVVPLFSKNSDNDWYDCFRQQLNRIAKLYYLYHILSASGNLWMNVKYLMTFNKCGESQNATCIFIGFVYYLNQWFKKTRKMPKLPLHPISFWLKKIFLQFCTIATKFLL